REGTAGGSAGRCAEKVPSLVETVGCGLRTNYPARKLPTRWQRAGEGPMTGCQGRGQEAGKTAWFLDARPASRARWTLGRREYNRVRGSECAAGVRVEGNGVCAMGGAPRTKEDPPAAPCNGDGAALAVRVAPPGPRLERMVRLRMDCRLQGRVDPSDVV